MMDIKNFKEHYLEKEEAKKETEKLLQLQKEVRIEEQKEKIKALAQDIAACIELGQFLLDHGHTLRGRESGGRFWNQKERDRHLVTDGWFHTLGFIVNNGAILGVGIYAGGYCGDVNLLVKPNGEVYFSDRESFVGYRVCCGWWQDGVNTFLAGFKTFKERVETYAQESLKEVK